jgi:hypothetical protein
LGVDLSLDLSVRDDKNQNIASFAAMSDLVDLREMLQGKSDFKNS